MQVVFRDCDFVRRVRERALHHIRFVDARAEQRLEHHRRADAVDLGVGFDLVAALGYGDTFGAGEFIDVVLGETERRLHRDVVEMLAFVERLGRFAQVEAGDGEPGEHRGAKRANRYDGKIAFLAAADCAQDVLGTRPHRSLLPLDALDGRWVRVELHVGHAAALEANEAVGHGGEGRVVRDDDDGDAVAPTGILEELQDLLACLVVEGACGLVAEQELGGLGDSASDGDALLLTARKLGGEVAQALGEAHLAEGFLGIKGTGAHLGRELDVFERSEVGNKVVELEHEAHVGAAVLHELAFGCMGDVATVDHDRSRRGCVHTAQDVERRGFASAGRAENDGKLAALDDEVRSVERVDLRLARAVCFNDVVELDVCHGSA